MSERYAATPWVQGPPHTTPPKDVRHKQHHWLHSERSTMPVIAEWIDGAWYAAGEADRITPEEMCRRGWNYLMPVPLPPGDWER